MIITDIGPVDSNEISDTENRSVCTLPPSRSKCRAAFIRWHYTEDENQCKKFIYGGCKPFFRGQNFISQKQCEEKCKQELKNGNVIIYHQLHGF